MSGPETLKMPLCLDGPDSLGAVGESLGAWLLPSVASGLAVMVGEQRLQLLGGPPMAAGF